MAELVLLTENDIERCAEIYYNANEKDIFKAVFDKTINKYFSMYINSSERYAYGIRDNNLLIGFVLALNIPAMTGKSVIYIDNLAVDLEYQHKGYCRQMLELFMNGFDRNTTFSLIAVRGARPSRIYGHI